MDHQSAQDLFTDHLEGTLGPEEEKRLKAHLDGCEVCAKELEVFKKTLTGLSGLVASQPNVELVGKVERRINRRSRGRFFGSDRLPVKWPFEWISFIIILVLLLLYLMEGFQTRSVEAPRPAKNAVPAQKVPAAPPPSATEPESAPNLPGPESSSPESPSPESAPN